MKKHSEAAKSINERVKLAILDNDFVQLRSLHDELKDLVWITSIPDGENPFYLKIDGEIVLRFVSVDVLSDADIEKLIRIQSEITSAN